MKESTLIELKNKVETLGAVLQQATIELTHLKDLSIGTLELVKQLDGYEEALEKLKKEITDGKAKKDTEGSKEENSGLDLGTEL